MEISYNISGPIKLVETGSLYIDVSIQTISKENDLHILVSRHPKNEYDTIRIDSQTHFYNYVTGADYKLAHKNILNKHLPEHLKDRAEELVELYCGKMTEKNIFLL